MSTAHVVDAVWAALALAALVVVVLSASGWAGVARPRALLRAATAPPVARVALVLGWMWLGWHLFAR